MDHICTQLMLDSDSLMDLRAVMQVAGMQPFSTWAAVLQAFCRGCDLHGYNIINFDMRLMEAEFQRIGGTGGLPLQFRTAGMR
jgi:hypothetical protein